MSFTNLRFFLSPFTRIYASRLVHRYCPRTRTVLATRYMLNKCLLTEWVLNEIQSILGAKYAQTGSPWVFCVAEFYRQKAKHYGLFLSSEIKIVFFDESDKASVLLFCVYFTRPRQIQSKRLGNLQHAGLRELTEMWLHRRVMCKRVMERNIKPLVIYFSLKKQEKLSYTDISLTHWPQCPHSGDRSIIPVRTKNLGSFP